MRTVTASIDDVWDRIVRHAGTLFMTVTGIEFRYHAANRYIRLNHTYRNISKSDFQKALSHVPFSGTTMVNRLSVQGPSYVYSILMDRRIRRGDW